jgi:hypothetical protein
MCTIKGFAVDEGVHRQSTTRRLVVDGMARMPDSHPAGRLKSRRDWLQSVSMDGPRRVDSGVDEEENVDVDTVVAAICAQRIDYSLA